MHPQREQSYECYGASMHPYINRRATSELKEERNGNDHEHGLNKNAKEFIPNNGYHLSKKSKLKTIYEKQTFPGCLSPESTHHKCKSAYDPMSEYQTKHQIHISRECSAKITDKIGEILNDVYVFMDKSLSLQTGQTIFNDGTLWVLNYGFHDKQTDQLLYCVAVPNQAGSRKWRMIPKLFTAQEMKSMYHIKYTSLPKSIRSLQFNTDIVNQTHIIKQRLSEPDQMQSIVRCTPWHKMTIFNRNGNKKRMILMLNKPEFMKHLSMCMALKHEAIKLIPILMFDTKRNQKHCAYHMEYMWMARIVKDIDIGISFTLNTHSDALMVSGIHLDKTFILNQHQLAIP
eukprot:242299_1